jgi:hypothetical protein
LAYLDDTLDPAQTKLIGQKVAETPAAQELIARIKEVVRRRRLTAPPMSGPQAKIDANTMAEYIDNALSPEQLAEVEQLCLESDLYLAELAACHQILTVVLSEPALVPPTAKRRMYGLVKGRESIPYRKATTEGYEEDGRATAERVVVPEEGDDTLLGLPVYRRGSAWLGKLAPFVGVCFLGVALVVAVFMALRTDPSQQRPIGPLATNRDLVPTPAPDKDKGDWSAKDKMPPDPDKDKAVVPPPDPDKDKAVVPPPDPDKDKAVVPPPDPDKDKRADRDKRDPPPPSARELGRYVPRQGEPSVLLSRGREGDPWRRVAAQEAVQIGEMLMSLPGYRSEIMLANGVRLTLWGDVPTTPRIFALESVVQANEPNSLDLDVTLLRGRVALANLKTQGDANIRIKFYRDRYKDNRIVRDEEAWELKLLGGESEVAMELWGQYPPGVPFSKEPGGEEPATVAGLFALSGECNLKIRYATFLLRAAPGANAYLWDNMGHLPSSPVPFEKIRPGMKLPEWASRPLPDDVQKGLRTLAAALDGKRPPSDVVAERVSDPDQTQRLLAVFALGALDELRRLIDCLEDPRHRDVRATTINVLRHWIGRSVENDLKLYDALRRKFNKSEPAESIMNLLHIYGPRQVTDPITYETLIAYLLHDRLSVRELAWSQLVTLHPDGRRIPYDPIGDTLQLRRAHDEWKREIPDGQLPRPREPKGK